MKLRKALERAKQERGDGAVRGEAVDEKQKPALYSQSRHTEVDETALKENLCVSYFSGTPEVDLYKNIRTQIIQKMNGNAWKTLIISSAFPGEGKSLTSINLAITFAKELHQKVLLVDADLRRQSVHQYLGYDSEIGLANFLDGGVPLSETIVWPGIENLSVISGGDPVRESTELLTSTIMRESMEEMKNRYSDRLIIFDTPPILTTPDTAAFVPFVDAVALVVEAESTSKANIVKAKKYIPEKKFVGFILNKMKSTVYKNKYTAYY